MYASKDRRSARTAKHMQQRINRGCLTRQIVRELDREIRMGWAR